MTPRKNDDTREKLIRGAMICVREKGYARTTARDIVAAAGGANLASIGYHCGSTEELLEEAIARGFESWTTEVERQAFAAEVTGHHDGFAATLVVLVDRCEALQPYLIAFVEAFAPAARRPELRERMAAAHAQARAAAADLVQRSLRSQGVAVSRPHAETLAAVLVAASDGLALQRVLDPAATASSAAMLDAFAVARPASR